MKNNSHLDLQKIDELLTRPAVQALLRRGVESGLSIPVDADAPFLLVFRGKEFRGNSLEDCWTFCAGPSYPQYYASRNIVQLCAAIDYATQCGTSCGLLVDTEVARRLRAV